MLVGKQQDQQQQPNNKLKEQKLIWVHVSTHSRLKRHGIVGQTFNQVIDSLLDYREGKLNDDE
jgi:hypothetical protein